MQIRSKLSLSFIGITLLLLLFSFIFIYISFRTHLYAEFYNSLKSKAIMTVTMVVKNNSDLNISENVIDEENIILPAKENILIYSLEFKKIFSFHKDVDISSSNLSNVVAKGEEKFQIGEFDALGLRHKTNAGTDVIIIAKGHFMSDELMRLRNIMIITFFLCLIIVAISGYYFAGQAMKPIVNTMNELDEILPTDLTKRIKTGSNNDEITRLAISFNKLLDRLEETFNVQKGFLSNISHELRNPLASIIANIDVTLHKKRSESEYEQVLRSVLHDATDLEHTSSHLMQLARLSAGSDKILFGPVRLDEMMWQVKAQVKKIHPEYSFKFEESEFPEDSSQLEVIANEALLKTALLNLMENACKFSPDQRAFLKVTVSKSNEAVIEIRDTAPVIAAAEIENIFKPFYRSSKTSKINGSGIGLSLVASIIKIHSAKLHVAPSPKGGNIFSVVFKSQNQNLSKI